LNFVSAPMPGSESTANLRMAIAGSVLVHVAAFIFLPPLLNRSERTAPEPVLEVQLVPAQPLPMASEVVQPPPSPRPPPPPIQRRVKRADPVKTPVARAPVLALNAPTEPRAETAPAPVTAPAAAPVPSAEAKAPANAEPAAAPIAPRAEAVITPPSSSAAYLNNPRPEYPRLARRNGDQGTVLLRVLVTPQGLPARVETEKSSGSPLLDEAALRAVKAWRFTPARKGLEAVEEWVRVPIVFRLQDVS
jgi:protein TonB